MNRDEKIRSAAALYVEEHGEHAVEVIRDLCMRIHRSGDQAGFDLWRRIGVAADEMLSLRQDRAPCRDRASRQDRASRRAGWR
jgi:hypothetical protein